MVLAAVKVAREIITIMSLARLFVLASFPRKLTPNRTSMTRVHASIIRFDRYARASLNISRKKVQSPTPRTVVISFTGK